MKRKIFVALAVVWAGMFYMFYELPYSDHAFLAFLDVGQGDSVFLRSPEGGTVLIDGGKGSTVLRRLASHMPFFDRQIDLLILTHPHDDHIGGLIEVLKKYEVKNVLIENRSYENAFYNEFIEAVIGEEATVYFADPSTSFRIGSVYLDVVYDGYEVPSSNLNDHSIALRAVYGDHVVYLGGDGEVDVEEFLLKSGQNLGADIFKASHHGSKTANSYEFVSKISPSIAVIQCGKGNSFGHPHAETLETFGQVSSLNEVYRTDVDGDVTFEFF